MYEYVDEGSYCKNGIMQHVHCYLAQGNRAGNLCIPHYHDYIEILYGLGGVVNVWMNSEDFHLLHGDLMIINSGTEHIVTSPGPYSYIVIKFTPEILSCERAVFDEIKYFLPLYRRDFHGKHFLKRDDISDSYIKNIVSKIYEEWVNEDFGYEIAVRGGIVQLFSQIIRLWKNTESNDFISVSNETTKIIISAAEYCKENYTNLTTSEIANYCNMSYSYFSRTFKKIMNMSFTQYLNDVKLTAATHLLLTTDKNSTEIAFETGFSSTSHFIHNFKIKTGLTPTAYKQKVLNTMT